MDCDMKYTNKRKGEIEKYPSCFEMREHLFVGDAT